MTVRETYEGSNGEATKALYAKLAFMGKIGDVAMNLFRAQKASERAKEYRRRYSQAAYDKKNWSIGLLCDALLHYYLQRDARTTDIDIKFGWKEDPNPPPGFPWVLYVDLPTGQVSFHAANRGAGPDYKGEWDHQIGQSAARIIAFVSKVVGEEATAAASPEFNDVVGWFARVPKKNGRGFWFKRITEQNGKYIKVDAGTASGRPYWTSLDLAKELKPPNQNETRNSIQQ